MSTNMRVTATGQSTRDAGHRIVATFACFACAVVAVRVTLDRCWLVWIDYSYERWAAEISAILALCVVAPFAVPASKKTGRKSLVVAVVCGTVIVGGAVLVVAMGIFGIDSV